MDRVELLQMRVHSGITDRVIDPSDLGTAVQQRLQRQLSDAAKAIECVGGHKDSPAFVVASLSTACCSAIRSSEWIGSAAKALIRFSSTA